MRGASLVPLLEQNTERLVEGDHLGLALTEYLQTSSVFHLPHSGNADFTDGVHQGVVILAAGKAIFRNLPDMLAGALTTPPKIPHPLRHSTTRFMPDFPISPEGSASRFTIW